MKVIILAAGINTKIDFKKPKCLLPYKDGTILQYQIDLLKKVGVNPVDIIVVIGKKGIEWNKETAKEIKDIHPNIRVNEKNKSSKNSFSLYMASKPINEDIIAIDGDIVFEEHIISKLIQEKDDNIIVSRVAYSTSEDGGKIILDGHIVKQVGEYLKPHSYPWNIHSGIIRLNKETLKDLNKQIKKTISDDMLDNINKILDKHIFYNFDYSQKGYTAETDDDLLKQNLVGGSYANLKKITIVRKEVDKKGKDKLVNEIKWLQTIPKELQHKFTKIKEYGVDDEHAWFEMEYYHLPCLRDLILSKKINADNTLSFLKEVLNFMFKKVYTRNVSVNKEKFIWDKHIMRVNSRILETKQRSPLFDAIFAAENIIINEVNYKNTPFLMQELCERPSLIKRLEPKKLVMVHGDLHFQNILVSPDNPKDFILVDPRGELLGSDLYYDMGKLLHSCNGLYDFIKTDKFSLNWKIKNSTLNARFDYDTHEPVKEYEHIKKELLRTLPEYELIRKEPDWKLKMFFAEAMHFSSLMPFHLAYDGREEKAIIMYLTGVRLLNNVFNDFNLWDIKKDNKLININSSEDYSDLLEQDSF